MSLRLGILGCGQLGQMLGRAAQKIGVEVCFLRFDESSLVDGLCQVFEAQDYQTFIDSVDYVTLEREAIPDEILNSAEKPSKLFPTYPSLMRLLQRHAQKRLFDELQLPTSGWKYVENQDQLSDAIDDFSCPRIRAKRVLGGYDGGGQWLLEKGASLPEMTEQDFPMILEEEISIDSEVSILLARSKEGQVQFYPMNQNIMHKAVLTWSFVPANISSRWVEKAQQYAKSLVDAIDYVGVLAMEFFVCGDNLLVNEIAPRVHNTGHWTIEGCRCDQFEQHVRAVMGMELLAPEPVSAAGLCNLLGSQFPKQLPEAPVRMHLHGYGKASRPGRKMGHVTLTGPDTQTIIQEAKSLGLFESALSELLIT